MKNGDQKGLDSPLSLPENKEPQAIMTTAWGSFYVLIKWSMRLRCGGWPQWSVIIPPKTVVCSEILTTDPVLKRNSNYQRERKPGETGENLPQIRVLSKKRARGNEFPRTLMGVII